VRLGEGTALSPAEGTIAQSNLPGAFDGKDRFLGVTIVIPGQTPAEILPRLAFLGTPFAYVANKSIAAERLVLPSSSAAGSSINLAQVSYVAQEVTAASATPSDAARSIIINSPTAATTITLPGAMATRVSGDQARCGNRPRYSQGSGRRYAQWGDRRRDSFKGSG
jgi:hypothetical protein